MLPRILTAPGLAVDWSISVRRARTSARSVLRGKGRSRHEYIQLGWAARTSAEFDQLRADRNTGYEWLATHDADWRRALEVQAALWRGGQIRAVGFPYLLVAAVAERERVSVLHYDADYDLIAQVTGQRTQWVAPRGTVP